MNSFNLYLWYEIKMTDAQVRQLWAEEVMRRVSAWQYARDEALASRARR